MPSILDVIGEYFISPTTYSELVVKSFPAAIAATLAPPAMTLILMVVLAYHPSAFKNVDLWNFAPCIVLSNLVNLGGFVLQLYAD